jgi:hypothetical protein
LYIPDTYVGVPKVLLGDLLIIESLVDPLKEHKRLGWGAALI